MGDFDVQGMFDYYLYDYLVKNDMGETAEIFRREANLNLDPTQPPPVDTPDGFLHEWWVIFHDMFRSRAGVIEERDMGSSVVTAEMVETDEQSEASSSRKHEMNEKLSGDQAISADPGLTMGESELPSFPSTKLPAMGNEQISQALFPSLHQQELLEFNEVALRMGASLMPPRIGDQVWNPFCMMEQGAGLVPPGFGNQVSDPFRLTELQEELEESREVSDSFWDTELQKEEFKDDTLLFEWFYGSIPQGFRDQVSDSFWETEEHKEEFKDDILLIESGENSSEESTTLMNKSSDDTIETSVTHAKGNGDKAGASLKTATSDTDASKGHVSWENKE